MMKAKKFITPLLLTVLIAACTSQAPRDEIEIKDINAFNILMGQFAHNIENIWGLNEVLIAGTKDYVKYTDRYKTRSHINFEAGTITVETILSTDIREHLRRAIVSTLLMGDDPSSVDLYSDRNDIAISREPFLYGQVLDHEGQPIRWEWRAAHYADYLVTNQLQSRRSGIHTIWSVTINLVPNHLDQRAHKYLDYIRKSARKYNVDESLILAIMETESSFNPYAVSRSDALGLMQIMQQSAGRDVFQMHGKSGYPSRSYLFDPEKNIDMGVAYIHILQNRYLRAITNPTSKRYAVITAYNGGAGSVLRVFSDDRERAAQIINRMSPEDVYKTLTTKHPSAESRRYLYKVDTAQKRYRRH